MTWTPPERVLDDASFPTAIAPALAPDPQFNGVHALFADTRSGGWLIYAAHAPQGGALGGVERVSEVETVEDLESSQPEIETALTVRGSMRYAVWTDPSGGLFFASAPLP
jgi:hypothetical protein